MFRLRLIVVVFKFDNNRIMLVVNLSLFHAAPDSTDVLDVLNFVICHGSPVAGDRLFSYLNEASFFIENCCLNPSIVHKNQSCGE